MWPSRRPHSAEAVAFRTFTIPLRRRRTSCAAVARSSVISTRPTSCPASKPCSVPR